MTRHLRRARPLAGVLALLVGLTLVAPPAFAAEASAPAPAAPAQPLVAAAAAMVEAVPVATLAQAAPAPKPATATAAETGHRPFFKTTQGAIALVLLAGTIAYTGYSLSNDRIKSPAK